MASRMVETTFPFSMCTHVAGAFVWRAEVGVRCTSSAVSLHTDLSSVAMLLAQVLTSWK